MSVSTIPIAPASPAPCLICRDLHFTYGRRPILDGLSLQVPKASIVGLLGSNGAGKTTCIQIVAGLRQASLGSVEAFGRTLDGLSLSRRARLGLGYLPQEPALFRRLSVADNLKLVLEEFGWPKDERDDRRQALLARFGLEHLRDQIAGSLSGGERRQLEIARTMATDPRLILVDEPFTGVDPLGIRRLQDELRRLADDGVAILLTDHNVRETLKICDFAVILDGGRVLCDGPPEAVAQHPQARRCYLGPDFTLDSPSAYAKIMPTSEDEGLESKRKDDSG